MTPDNELTGSPAAVAEASLVPGNDGITMLASERTTNWRLSVSVEHLGANVLSHARPRAFRNLGIVRPIPTVPAVPSR